MAETKKAAIAKPVAKAAAVKATETKTEEAKTTPATPVAPVAEKAPTAEVKTEETKKTTRKTTAKKTTAKKAPVKKAAAEKKAPAKKETIVKKAEEKVIVHVQFAGKAYTTEDLVNIAKDVWKYDLNQKVEDFKTVELYVKPEEHVVYYVINEEVKGNFNI